MLLCMFVGTAWAQVPTASTAPSNGKWAADTKWYAIKQNNSNYVSLGNVDGDGYLMLNSTDAKRAAALWCVVGNETDGYQLYNYTAGTTKVLGAYGSEANGRMKMYDLDATTDGSNNLTKTFDIVALEGESGFAFVKNHGSERDWWNYRDGYLAYWNSDYAYAANCDGSKYTFIEVTDFTTLIDIPATKDAAVAKLNSIKKLNLFNGDKDVATINSAITAIQAVSCDNTLSSLDEAYSLVMKKTADACDAVYNKTIRLTSYGRNQTDGNDLTIVADGANSASKSGDSGLWTMTGLSNGTFALYNFVSNLYLGPTVGGSVRIPAKKTIAEAGGYTFDLVDEENQKVNLNNNGNLLHVEGWYGNIVQWNDKNNASNQWKIEESADIVVSREVYDAAAAAATALPYAVQQAYGLVTDATKFTSNAKETAEGSYEALIDNVYNDPSYFHTSWSQVIGAHHYLQVEVSEGVKDFYFYFKKRQGNNNNRPTEIEIQGSADGKEFTTIKTISEGLPVDAGVLDYMSDVVNASATVKYIRFVVKQTNNGAHKDDDDGHPFFTFSEFYVLSSNNYVASLVASYKAFSSSSIQSQEMASAANALINAEKVLSLANIKKQVAALIAANASNHAVAPALGQYPTAAYNELKAAYDSNTATQESLETALAAFKASQVVPVYFITSLHDGYAAGSAILYNGTEWRWAKANKYNRQMWMTISGYTQPNVPVVDAYEADGTNYEICDYLTGTVMRGKKVQIVKIADWEGAYNLQYNADANSTDAAHHAKDNGQLVNWKPATSADSKASAWQVEYIGTSYELANLTDEKIEALDALKTAYDAKAYYKNAVIGNGIGQYKGDQDAIVAELAKAEGVYAKTLVEQANMTVEEINAIAKSITDVAGLTLNMPETGFYRVKSLNGNDANKAGKYWQIGVGESGYTAMEAGTDLEKSIVYIKSNGETYNIVNYVSGLNLNNYAALDPAGTAAKSWTIVENNAAIGAYALYAGTDTYCLSDWLGITYGQKDANAVWAIEAVDALPVNVTDVGYATLYAPVALTLAEGINAYYVSAKSATNAALTKIESAIPAHTAVVLEAAEGSYNLKVVAEATAVSGNMLAGTVAATYVDQSSYVLANGSNGIGFYLAEMNQEENTSFLNNGFKAYLPADGSNARFISFDFGTETAIESVESVENNVVVYDLAGRRIQGAQKGIFIVNGKKVVK